MRRTTIDFGIDLGTTNSTVAVIDGIDAKVIPNKAGSGITPSAVWIDRRGSIHVGQEAKLGALIEGPDNADLDFKLRMGLGSEGKKLFVRSGREMLPEELSAEVLKILKEDVQRNMGEELRAAVITVPAVFGNPQTTATRKAAQLAGFVESPLLLEPYAASVAYGFQTQSQNVYWMVYDFGGGAFDAAILRIQDGLIQLVDHDGDSFLGGKFIDCDIVTKRLIPALTDQFNVPDFRRGNARWKAAIGKLKYHAELAKVEVCRSKAPSVIWIEGLCEDADGRGIDFAYTLTPEDVEQVTKPYIEKSLSLCLKTLSRTGLAGSDLERVLMVGGSTLNPWVRDAVHAELCSRAECGIDPVTVVARGAAIFASTQALPRDKSAPMPTRTVVDDVEDSVERPVLLEKAQESRKDTERVVEQYGEASDRNRLRVIKEELQRAVDTGHPDLLRGYIEELDGLFFQVLNRQPGFHVGAFNWLVDRLQSLPDRRQAEQVVAQGRRAINNNDIDALKAATLDLLSLVPEHVPLDEVRCSVFSPAVATPCTIILIQVFAHTPAQADETQALAAEFDDKAERRAIKALRRRIPRGSRLHFLLTMPGLRIDDPVQELTWNGIPESVQFGVAIPTDVSLGTVIGTVLVSQDTVPVGHIKFKLTISEEARAATQSLGPVGHDARCYRMAFISYSSTDREKVLARVQMLQAVGIRYFQDILDLDPGTRWEQELYRHIDESDLFLLFWSSAASKSEWVLREIRYALDRKGNNDCAPPEIRPVIIEGPPIAPPPRELAHLHFNDRVLFLMS